MGRIDLRSIVFTNLIYAVPSEEKRMKEIIASPNRVLHLGYEGEDNVTVIKFPYDDTWLDCGDGEFKIRVLRHGDTQAYNATEVIDDRDSMLLTMTVTDIELSVKGRGELQLVYVCANAVKKSEIYRYNINRAIDTEIDVNPPRGSVIAEVEESLVEIKDEIGSLSELTTTDKTSLVSAINEVNAKESGSSVSVDAELSGMSENPVQNKVVKGRFDGIDETISGISRRLTNTENAITGKVDKSYVDAELSDKANTEDVNTALSGKANSSDVYTKAQVDTALNGKAGTAVATPLSNGLMSAQDKEKLDSVGAVVSVSGTAPTVIAESGTMYVCGEITTLDFTPCQTGICDIVFTSGNTPTAVTLPSTVKFPDGVLVIEANTTYEINILDGVYGVVMSWI